MTKDLVDLVYDQLLSSLCEQGLPVPELLNVANIAKDLGVSRTPVTMALVRLECDGLVRRDRDQGWITVQPTVQDVAELFDIRSALEALTARRAAERITPEGAAELMRAVEDMEAAAETNDLAAWREADYRFHRYLHDTVGNRRIRRIHHQIEHQMVRINGLSMVLSDNMSTSAGEHRAIAEAIVAGDAERAVEMCRKHTSARRSSIQAMMKNVLGPLLGRQG